MIARLAAILVMAMATSAVAATRDVTGHAQVRDGDSLVIGGRELRLDDIDAPEWDQACTLPVGKQWHPGREGAAWLTSFLDGRVVSCVGQKTDAYGRLIAHCYIDGQDLSAVIVSAGWAFAYRRYSDRQVAVEAEARKARRGLWRGTCESPERWRHAR